MNILVDRYTNDVLYDYIHWYMDILVDRYTNGWIDEYR